VQLKSTGCVGAKWNEERLTCAHYRVSLYPRKRLTSDETERKVIRANKK
jgi:hypothetical protein